jgi:hypothetical protein
MSSFRFRHCEAADIAAIAEVVAAHERACFGDSTYGVSDLEDEWRTNHEVRRFREMRIQAYGGGWVDVLFTRAPWRRRGVGAQSETGAFRVYERLGMKPAWAGVTYEKALGD